MKGLALAADRGPGRRARGPTSRRDWMRKGDVSPVLARGREGIPFSAVAVVATDQTDRRKTSSGWVDAAVTYPARLLRNHVGPRYAVVFSSADIPGEAVDVVALMAALAPGASRRSPLARANARDEALARSASASHVIAAAQPPPGAR